MHFFTLVSQPIALILPQTHHGPGARLPVEKILGVIRWFTLDSRSGVGECNRFSSVLSTHPSLAVYALSR